MPAPPLDAALLHQWATTSAWIATLSNAELAILLEAAVWLPIPLRTLESDVLREAIQRLRGEEGGTR